jgi:hypothetical protein
MIPPTIIRPGIVRVIGSLPCEDVVWWSPGPKQKRIVPAGCQGMNAGKPASQEGQAVIVKMQQLCQGSGRRRARQFNG